MVGVCGSGDAKSSDCPDPATGDARFGRVWSGRRRSYQTFRLSAAVGRGTGRTMGRMCRCGAVRAELIMAALSHRAARAPMGVAHISRWGVLSFEVGSASSGLPVDRAR